MEKLILKINRVVEETREVPEYFRMGISQYFRIVSDQSYVSVSNYDVTKEEMEGLILLPEIRVSMVSHLYIYIRDKEIVEINKEEFTKAFDTCMNFIDRL